MRITHRTFNICIVCREEIILDDVVPFDNAIWGTEFATLRHGPYSLLCHEKCADAVADVYIEAHREQHDSD